jgi:hypothetical protein
MSLFLPTADGTETTWILFQYNDLWQRFTENRSDIVHFVHFEKVATVMNCSCDEQLTQ